MKKVFSTMMILMAVTMVAITGIAGGYANGQIGKPEQPEKDYKKIIVSCKADFQSKSSPVALNEATSWYFHGYLTNKTGQVIPKGTKIEYSFSSLKPGYFQTNSGGVMALKGAVVLKQALGVNSELYIGGVTFVTTKNPAKINASAFYLKYN
jgi:hypothetical protein